VTSLSWPHHYVDLVINPTVKTRRGLDQGQIR
jgi:hypothetical protein